MKEPYTEHFEKYLNALDDLHALVIGDSMLDRYIQGKITRISPEAPVPILQMTSVEMKLGGAANVAMNIKALGAKATLISTIGGDQAGRNFLAAMSEAGLDSQHITTFSGPTTVKTRIMSGSQHILRVDEEEVSPIDGAIQSEIKEKVQHVIRDQHPDVIILQDYNKGLFTEGMIAHITKMASDAQIPICVDPKFDHFFAFQGVHIFKPNLAEVRKAVPLQVDITLPSLNEVDMYVRKKLDHNITVITLGSHGVYLNDGSHSCIIETSPRDIVDVCGAGDAVIGSIGLAASNTFPLETIGQIANTAGGLVCEKVGVASIPKDQFILELMKNSKYNI